MRAAKQQTHHHNTTLVFNKRGDKKKSDVSTFSRENYIFFSWASLRGSMALPSVQQIIVLAVLLTVTAATAQQHCDTLSCYLEKLTVKFPNTAFTVNGRGLTAHFNSFACTGFSIDALSTSALGNATKGTLSVDFSPALSCHGEFQLETNGTAYGGDFTATLSKNTSVSITASLLTAEKLQPDLECVLHGVPDALTLDHCKIHIRLAELRLVARDPSKQPFVDDLLAATREAVEGAVFLFPLLPCSTSLYTHTRHSRQHYLHLFCSPFPLHMLGRHRSVH